MRLSEERIEVLAGRLADRLLDEELVDITVSERAFMDLLEVWITRDLEIEEEINEAAVARLESYSRKIEHGTSEWEALLDKAKEELARSRGYVIR
ncbi:MAG: DUF507 family protein [Candidatus Krumholzibacteriia bacterium]|nr:DUF507 family protein [bacterium]MCB9513318.1 DUF507 family protein [Candidatus Latescibacterota bacterium]MCB9514778.1 DUF507 family protein [Candidatus Latescibacterota bacterium]